MSKKKLIIALVAVAVLVGGGIGGAMWFLAKPAAPGSAAAKPAPEKKEEPKYVTLEKVIVMLRRGEGESDSHYLSVDLVLTTSEKKEKLTKEHLPLLRSIAVRALSNYTMAKASSMTVDQYAEQISHAFEAHYVKENAEKPFSEVMIGKLIIE